jgi:hypothetical protein
MTCKDLEQKVFEYFDKFMTNVKVTHNHKIKGKLSGRSRQIDVFLEGIYEGKQQTVVIDTKNYNKKIDIKHIEAFIGMVKDIGANKGIIITSIGFTKSAIKRTHNDFGDFELDILREIDIEKDYAGCHIYKANYGAILTAPFGLLFDYEQVGYSGFLTFAYPKGLSFEESIKKREFLGIDILSKKTFPFNIETYFKNCDNFAKIKYSLFIERQEIIIRPTKNNIKLYENRFQKKDDSFEIVGILENDDFYIIAYLHGKDAFKNRDIEKLLFIFENVFILNVQQKGILEMQLAEVQNAIDIENDFIKKSELSFFQAKGCIDYEEFEMANMYLKRSLEYYNNNFGTLLLKLKLSLEFSKNDNEISENTLNILHLGLINSNLFIETGKLFQLFEKLDLFITILESVITNKTNLINKEKGHIYFAISKSYFNNTDKQLENLKISLDCFKIESDVEMVKLIKNMIKDYKKIT